MSEKERFKLFGMNDLVATLDSVGEEVYYSTQLDMYNVTFGIYTSNRDLVEFLHLVDTPVITYYGSNYAKEIIKGLDIQSIYHPYYEDNIYVVLAVIPTKIYMEMINKSQENTND